MSFSEILLDQTFVSNSDPKHNKLYVLSLKRNNDRRYFEVFSNNLKGDKGEIKRIIRLTFNELNATINSLAQCRGTYPNGIQIN